MNPRFITSQSMLRNSEPSQTFEQCSCTPQLVVASALLWDSWIPTWHTRCICSISVTMCWVRSKEMFSEGESLHNVSLRSFSNSSATLAILTSVTAVDGLPERALSITRVLLSLKRLHHWNTAAWLIVSPPYACRNISSVSLPLFPSLTQNSITHLCCIFLIYHDKTY